MIIAVDGPAASGKGTLSRRLADHFGYAYLDTGRTYRGVAHALHRQGLPFDDEAAAKQAASALDFTALDDLELNSPEIGEGASQVAVMPGLREVLVTRQRTFAEAAEGGAVLDGRDIGTVVCPDAALKLFVTASVEVRARRRSLQLYGTEDGPGYEALLVSLARRDERDSQRAASPLRPAPDAHLLDTTAMSIDDAVATAVALVEKARLP